MTAEIAVLNTTAVALAADSAASTVPFSDKIYSSVDKLFQLVENAPVGIMINGSSKFLGVPWETIIKVYRRERDREEFLSLAEYMDDFLMFIEIHQGMFPIERQHEFTVLFLQSYLTYLRELIEMALDETISEDGISPKEVSETACSVIEAQYQFVIAQDRLDRFSSDEVDEIQRLFEPQVETLKDEVFANLPLDAQSSSLVIDQAIEVLTRDFKNPERTGLVFAGFGEEEYFPQLLSVDVDIMVNGRIRAAEVKEQCVVIGPNNSAAIMPFAQHEMVSMFLQGIHPEMAAYLSSAISELFSEFRDRLCRQLEDRDPRLVRGFKDQVTTEVQSILDDFNLHWDELYMKHWMPIIDNVAVLPMDELAAMAETLVNLTKFRMRISQERETVGGSIDVVVISKGDGFVWIKQKQYFKHS